MPWAGALLADPRLHPAYAFSPATPPIDAWNWSAPGTWVTAATA